MGVRVSFMAHNKMIRRQNYFDYTVQCTVKCTLLSTAFDILYF